MKPIALALIVPKSREKILFVSAATDTKDLEGQQDQLLKILINKLQILPTNKKQLFLNKTI